MPEINSKSDIALLARVQRNDEGALAVLMKTYLSSLLDYGLGFTNDREQVKDCIQEIFISLWHRRETAHTILSPKFYLLRAVKNKVLKSLSCLHNRNVLAEDNTILNYDFLHQISTEEILIRQQVTADRAKAVSNAISQLSLKQKEIIHLKYYQYLDHEQIADLMNISRQSAYNLLHDALRRLRGVLQSNFV